MKKALLIVFMLTIQHIVVGQDNYTYTPLYIIEKINNVDFDSIEISFKDFEYNENIKNLILENNTLNDSIVLKEPERQIYGPIPLSDKPFYYKDISTKTWYYSNTNHNEILHIKHKGENMYVLLPKGSIYLPFGIEGKVPYFMPLALRKHPYLSIIYHIANIDFQAGVFIMNNYDEQYHIQAIYSKDLWEIHTKDESQFRFGLERFDGGGNFEDIEVYRKTYPLDSLYMFSFFKKDYPLPFKKSYLGNFTAQEAVEILLQHSERHLDRLFEKKYYRHSNSDYKSDEEISEFKKYTSPLGRKNTYKLGYISGYYVDHKISIMQAYALYEELSPHIFPNMLYYNWELYKAYYKYFDNIKQDLKPFYKFIEKQNYELTEELLWDFINSQQKKKKNKKRL